MAEKRSTTKSSRNVGPTNVGGGQSDRHKTPNRSGDDMEPISKYVCGQVKQLRKRKGWTLEELAAQSGVSRSMLSQVERGAANPTLTVAFRIAQAFDVSLGDLVDGAGGGPVFRHDEQCPNRIRRSGVELITDNAPSGHSEEPGRSWKHGRRTGARSAKHALPRTQTQCEATEIAKYLLEAIRSHTPDYLSNLAPAKLEQRLARWAKDIELGLRIDSHAGEDYRAIIDMCHRSSDLFWRDKLCRGKKVREKHDDLRLRLSQRRPPQRPSNTGAFVPRGEYTEL